MDLFIRLKKVSVVQFAQSSILSCRVEGPYPEYNYTYHMI